MKRNTALKFLNPVLLVLFVSQAVTAVFHDKISYETFRFFHKGGGTILIVLILLHIILNLNWFKAIYFKK